MSTTVDNRVLEMRFDNKQFESGVATSMSTIEKLKQKLKFSGASKGLEGLEKAAKKVSFDGMSKGIETVNAKFSAMQVIGMTALSNITNQAINAGKRIASALTIEPVKTGFQEYETQIGAIQTILSNTRQEGTNVEIVNRALDELNTYADKTIYNFTEMTRNIGTFTAAGVKLDTSVNAIKGIANLAAVSGSTSQQASTAMYQLSQALAAGRVSLMDWNSVVNAGMGGKLFQDALVRTSELLGTGAKSAIEFYGSFRESLTKGEWLTTEVLTETLNQLSGAYSKADLMAQGFSEDQANEIMTLAKDAEDAATKVKTFTQLVDTVKESIQSGWSQTWRILLGDFDEAKELFTGISDSLGKMIEASAKSRNELLEGAMSSNWDKLVSSINKAGIETDIFEEKIRSVAEAHDIDIDKLIKEHGSLEKAFRSGAISSDILKEAVNGLKIELIDLSGVEAGLSKGKTGDDVAKVQKALQNMNYDIGDSGADGIFGSATEAAIKAFQEANDLEVTGIVDDATLNALNEANESTNKLIANVDKLIDGITELGGREKIIESLKNVFKFLGEILKPIKEAFREIFPPTTVDQVVNMIDRFKAFTETLKISEDAAGKIKSTFKGIFSVIDVVIEAFKAVGKGALDILGNFTGLGGGILGLTSSFGDFLSNIRDSVVEGNLFGKTIDKIVGFISGGIGKIKEFGSSIKESMNISSTFQGFLGFFKGIWNLVKNIGSNIASAFGDIGNMIAEAFGKGDIFEVLNSGLFASILLAVRNFIKGLSDPFENISFLDNIKNILDGVRGSLESWQSNLKAGTLLKIAGAIGILAAALWVISGIDEAKLGSSLVAIGSLFVELISALAILEKINSKSVNPLSGIVSSLSGIARTVQMIGLAAAVAILAGTMKIIASLDWDGVSKGLVGIGGMVAILVTAAKLMNTESKSITKFAGQMLILSAAVAALSGVAKILGSMSWGELGKAGAGILGLVTILVAAAKIMNTESKLITKFAGQMLIMSSSIAILSGVAKILGSMSWEELGKAGAGILGIVTMLVTAAKVMSKGGGSIAKFGGQMILMASALAIFAPVMKSLGSMSWESIGKGLLVIGAALVELSIGLKAMNGSLAGSAALIVAALGLALLTPVLHSLGGMSWSEIGKGLITLAGAFAVIGIAGALLSPLAPALLALSAAMGVFALAIAGIGVGIFALSAGFTMLATAGAAGAVSFVAALTTIITGILGLVPQIAQIIGQGIVEIAKIIGEYAPQLADSFLKLILGVLQSLETNAPQIVDSLLGFIIGVINSLGTHVPELISAVMNFVNQVVKGIVDSIGKLDMDSMLKGIGAFGAVGLLMKVFAGAGALAGSAMVGVLAVGAVIAEIAVLLAAIGGLSKIPGFSSFIEAGGGLLGKIGNAIGTGIGAFIGGIGEGITGSLPQMGQDIADFMENLSTVGENASKIKPGSFEGVTDLITTMGQIGLTTVGTSLSDIFTLGGSSMEKFETDGVAFFNAMKAISEASSGVIVDEDSMSAIIGIASQLATLQSSLEPIGGVINWFKGKDDLGSFGKNIGQFISSMKTAFQSLDGTSFNTSALTSIVKGATALSKLQSSLDPIGGVISWFKGRDDLGTFGESVASFISSMKIAFQNLDGVTFNSEAINQLVVASESFNRLNTALPKSGGVAQDLAGEQDLAAFGKACKAFASCMLTINSAISGEGFTFNSEVINQIAEAGEAFNRLNTALPKTGSIARDLAGEQDLAAFGLSCSAFASCILTINKATSGEGFTFNSEAINQLAEAGEALNTLQDKLPKSGGWWQSVAGEKDIGDFGKKISAFGEAMASFATSIGDGISETAVTSVENAGTMLTNLQTALPEEGWFDGKMNLEEFSGYVTKFSEAMGTFSTNSSDLNLEGITSAITAAHRVRGLIEVLSGLDASGVSSFIGTGYGDGYLVNIGQAMAEFGFAVSEMQIDKVDTAVSAATRLKTFITGLSGIDTSGVENFKPETIGKAIKGYSDSVAGIDPGIVSTSISTAVRLKTFIADLAGFDSSGVSSFNPKPIGDALNSYSTSVSGMDTGSVTSSISAANKIKTFIVSLSDFDSGSVASFKSSVELLGQTNVSGLIKAFTSKVPELRNIGSDLMQAFITGVKSQQSSLISTATSIITSMITLLNSKRGTFTSVGTSLMTAFVSGVRSQSSNVISATTSSLNSATSAARGYYGSFYSAGSYVASGLAAGIRANIWSAANAAAQMAASAAAAARANLRIHSPSRVFKEIGSWVPKGFAQGIGLFGSIVEKSVTKMSSIATDNARNAVDTIYSVMNSDMDYQPTIRPVVDLSKVRSGFGYINSMLKDDKSIDVQARLNSISRKMNDRNQNGNFDNVVSAINKMRKDLGKLERPSYNINGITYDDGSNVSNAIAAIVREARIERRR